VALLVFVVVVAVTMWIGILASLAGANAYQIPRLLAQARVAEVAEDQGKGLERPAIWG